MARLRIVHYLNQFFGGIGGEPMVGMAWLPLNLRRILLSIPCGFLQDFYTDAVR